MLLTPTAALADGQDKEGGVGAGAETVDGVVRVTVVRVGGEYSVRDVNSGSGTRTGCRWTLVFVPELGDAPYGTAPGPKPTADSRLALLLCDGQLVHVIWVAPSDVIDLDLAAETAAQRYVKDVLVPAVRIGVNPAANGLVGLESWYWITGFDGTVTAPPIAAFGMTIDVRMASGAVRWSFGDGTELAGDLGRAYPAESSVRHAHQRDGTFTITADIALLPEYRVDGGPWLPLPALTARATTREQVEERQAVITAT